MLTIIIIASLYGATMKLADLCDEHGLWLFRGDAILFGILWGIFGSLLVLVDEFIANIMLAMNLAFIVRGRLDYFNHQLASSLIILTFLFSSPLHPFLFGAFYVIFVIFGSTKDFLDDVLKKSGPLATFFEIMPYYPIPTFIYSIISGYWIVFIAFLTYTVSYNAVKYAFQR
ncbi:MAG: hypothetical protein WC659_05455 [Patescibacteria group bacterium]